MASGSFTANGQNSPIVSGDVIDSIVAGTFTATVQLQTQIGGVWVPFGANMTAAGARTDRVGSGRGWRLSVIAFTSGPISYEINGAHDKSMVPVL